MNTLRFRRAGGAVLGALCLCLFHVSPAPGQDALPRVHGEPLQPIRVNLNRLLQALDYIGRPLPPEETKTLFELADGTTQEDKLQLIQSVLDPHCLMAVQISPESRVSVERGPAAAQLVAGDWTAHLVKVRNEAGVTAPLGISSEQEEVEAAFFVDRPLNEGLSGAPLEYRILALRTSHPGKVSAVLSFDVGQGSQDLGFRSDLLVNFDATPTMPLTLEVVDEGGEPTTACFEIRDEKGVSYPSQVNRIAPDFRFHPQVYRDHGQSLPLPAGKYVIYCTRGPEYLPRQQEVTVGNEPVTARFELKRWIDPSDFGYWSGDHHIHAAGCKHYENPTEGVHAPDMALHCRGEDLKIGANLTWGPCFDYQKQFFTGAISDASKYPYLLRYDVEVSGFGSHRSGHLCLLRLRDQIYPGGDSSDHWPTLCLNTLKWAQQQGAVCGPAHSGWGLAVKSDDLPNYEIPPYDGIGANEYIVDLTHKVPGPDGSPVPAVDFLSMVDTPYVWELNIWYHTLNCGYRTRISGETDFPCIYGERVGLGRSYIRLAGELDYDDWCEGISTGKGYVSDGRSHLIDFKVNDVVMGAGRSEVKLSEPGPVNVTAKVAALLHEDPEALSNTPHGRLQRDKPDIAAQPYVQKPYWHIERARLPGTRDVKVELIVNGYPVAEKVIEADGTLQDISFDGVQIDHSSWVAMRILPSSHTNPVFVLIGDQPIRASKRSAEWCLKSVEQCWSQKEAMIDPSEMEDAKAAYAHARESYEKIFEESVDDLGAAKPGLAKAAN